MEDLVNGDDSVDLFRRAYHKRRVLVTGHTGFKGSWLALWLRKLGAEVSGYALVPNTLPSHHQLLDLGPSGCLANIVDQESVYRHMAAFEPEIVFHLAAQPLVRDSYRAPVDTFKTNILGTACIYDACRRVETVRAIVSITTDKVYRNNEWDWGYREVDALGGHDPYSASKACAELVSSSFRASYWPSDRYGCDHSVLLATARAGNVIGGGDWAKDRLIPDLMRSVELDAEAVVRNPQSTRPWQHVLDPLLGYLMLGRNLLMGDREFADAWNFGPSADDCLTVADVVSRCQYAWPRLRVRHEPDAAAVHEATRLSLDCAKAQSRIGWRPVWTSHEAIERTIEWYREYHENKNVVSARQLQQFAVDARAKGMRGLA